MANSHIPLTQDRLKQLLDYNPETGVFTWLPRSGKRPNTRYAGQRAGTANSDGRRYISIKKEFLQASHLAWLYMTGEWPTNEIDHKNTNPGDDSFDNLRLATSAQNKWNTRKQKNHSGRLKGAYFHKQNGRWRSQIMKDRVQYHLGMFDTEEEAHAAYTAKAKELFGEFARS